MVCAIATMPSAIGSITVAIPNEKMIVIPTKRVFCLKLCAKYDGKRTLKQHGIASATTPATKATIMYANTRSDISCDHRSFHESSQSSFRHRSYLSQSDFRLEEQP